MVLDASNPKQLADPAKCVAYDVQHDVLTYRHAERSYASDAVRIKTEIKWPRILANSATFASQFREDSSASALAERIAPAPQNNCTETRRGSAPCPRGAGAHQEDDREDHLVPV